jgi:hypothetical protein
MDTAKRTMLLSVSICLFLWLVLAACGQNPVEVTYISYTPTQTQTLVSISPTQTIIPTATFPAPALVFSTPTPICFDRLTFLDDLTIPDDSVFTPGSTMEKQWLIQNSGSCNWDNRYRLRLINGDAFGASPEQALFPARSGMQVILQINFVAPLEAGEYLSEWQAFDAQGIPFGDSFYIKIIVQ